MDIPHCSCKDSPGDVDPRWLRDPKKTVVFVFDVVSSHSTDAGWNDVHVDIDGGADHLLHRAVDFTNLVVGATHTRLYKAVHTAVHTAVITNSRAHSRTHSRHYKQSCT